MIIISIFFILSIEILVLSCCAMAGSDPLARKISDQEQIEFIMQWNQRKNS